ncbi:MAG: hypothetical protein ACOC22_01620 [bacterium]
MRKLASIQRISNISPIPDADAIEVAQVLGWKVVVKKNQFKVNDLVVYCEIDSLMPDRPEFEFLRKNKFRIRTIRMRGQISQGICFPLDILPKHTQWHIEEMEKARISGIHGAKGVEGMDVTDILNIEKYEPPIPAELAGEVKGAIPSFLIKTDEDRIQILPEIPAKYGGLQFVATEKLDGCLDGDTTVETEIGVMTIREICNKKYLGKVKSYDFQNDKIVYCKIINHSINKTQKKWYEIELDNGVVLKLTENHKVWLPKLGCWRRADKLTGDEDILFL